MSWSVHASGLPGEVRQAIHEQMADGPLADKPAGVSDDGERETVKLVGAVIDQCLGTFGKEINVRVSAYGHISFTDWDTKSGACQRVNLSIELA